MEPREIRQSAEKPENVHIGSGWHSRNELIQFGGLGHEVSPKVTMYQMLIKINLRDAFAKVEVLLRICNVMIIVTVAEMSFFPSRN